MKVDLARSVAHRVLVRVLVEDAFAAAVLSAELSRHVQLDGRDRGFATELVFGTLRSFRHLEGRLVPHTDRGLGGVSPEVRAALVLGAYQLVVLDRVPAFAAVSSSVELAQATSKGGGRFANAVLRKLAAEVEQVGKTDAKDAALLGAPRWLLRALDRALGPSGGKDHVGAGPVPPPVCLRVRRGDRDAHVAALRESHPDAEIEPGGIPRAIRVRGLGPVADLPAVAAGDLVVQEEGSQRVALAVATGPGHRVLDACAGRGNKTLLLLDEGATVEAADLHPAKLDRLATEAERLGLPSPVRHATDLTVGLGSIPEGAFDEVLVDAPCSGVGTLRRRPEILLRRRADDLVELAALQRKILTQAIRAAKPGGLVVYAVCSVLEEELEAVVADVPGARLEGEIVRLLPSRDGTDGYGLAKLRRDG